MNLVNNYTETAEKASHSLFKPEEKSSFVRAASHAFGYVGAPLYYAYDKIIGTPAPKKEFPWEKNWGFKSSYKPRRAESVSAVPHTDKKMSKSKTNKIEKKIERKIARKIAPVPHNKFRGPRPWANRRRGGGGFRRGSRGTAKMGQRGRTILRTVRPPVRTGYVRRPGAVINFSAGKKPGCMVIRGKFSAGTIMGHEFGGAGGGTILGDTQYTTNLLRFYIQLANRVYFPSPLHNFCELFSRGKARTKIEYVGTCGTSTNGTIRFGYFQDPMTFFFENGKNEDFDVANCTSVGELSASALCVDGPVHTRFMSGWSQWASGDPFRYIAASWPQTTVIPTDSSDPAEVRQAVQGCWAYALNGVASIATNQYVKFGEMWVHYEIELCELMFTQTDIDLSRAIADLQFKHREKKSKKITKSKFKSDLVSALTQMSAEERETLGLLNEGVELEVKKESKVKEVSEVEQWSSDRFHSEPDKLIVVKKSSSVKSSKSTKSVE